MEWVNITAKSLPEAIDLALDNLGVDEAEAEIEVLEEPRQGLFGRTRGNARVRARVKPKGTRPKVERGRTRKRRSDEGGGEGAATGGGGRGARGGDGAARSTGGSGGGAGTRTRSRSGAAARGRDDDAVTGADEGTDTGAAAADTARADDGGGRSDRGGDRGGERSRGGRSSGRSRGDGGNGSANGRSSSGERQSREPVEEASMEEVSAQLETFLSGLTEAFGFDGGVTVAADPEEGLLGSVDGRHGLMVGPRARTLDAIQELARVSVQRTAPSSIRIKVDVGGYRELRKEALRSFALEAAAAVRADGKERSLEPMSSADRKVVHDTLSEESGIETRSAGNEPNRRVVVMAAAGSRVTDDADEDETEVDEAGQDSPNGDGGAVDRAEADDSDGYEADDDDAEVDED